MIHSSLVIQMVTLSVLSRERKVRTLVPPGGTRIAANSRPMKIERCDQKRPAAKAEGGPNLKLVGPVPL